MVSFVKLSEVTGDKAYVGNALDVALGMQQRGILAPRDAWMIEDLKRESFQELPSPIISTSASP